MNSVKGKLYGVEKRIWEVGIQIWRHCHVFSVWGLSEKRACDSVCKACGTCLPAACSRHARRARCDWLRCSVFPPAQGAVRVTHRYFSSMHYFSISPTTPVSHHLNILTSCCEECNKIFLAIWKLPATQHAVLSTDAEHSCHKTQQPLTINRNNLQYLWIKLLVSHGN